ncbi:MAG: EMC3/TMCO1 family protein [Minisyncoccales bacterium]
MVIEEILTSYPRLSLIIIAILVTLVMSVITKKVTDQNRMKELKEIQKACNIKLKNSKDNPKEMEDAQKQIMECSMELMKHSFKPMLFTFIPLVILIWWLRDVYTATALGGSWIWWYIGAGVISSIIIRKALKIV